MLTNILFGQPSVSAAAADPLSVKATEGPVRQKGNRSFSDHLDDRPRKSESNSPSQNEASTGSESRAKAARDDRNSPKATESKANRTERKEDESSDLAATESSAKEAEDASSAGPAETGAAVEGDGADSSDQTQTFAEVAEELVVAVESKGQPSSAKVDAGAEVGTGAAGISGDAAEAENLDAEASDDQAAAAIVAKGGDPLSDGLAHSKDRQAQTGNAVAVGAKASGSITLSTDGNTVDTEGAESTANLDPAAEEAEVKLTSKAAEDSASLLRGNGAAQVQISDSGTRRPGEKVAASATGVAGSAAASDAFENAMGEVSEAGETEAEIDVATVVRESAGKAGATAEGAASLAATATAEPGRRAQGRERESLEVRTTVSANAETQSTNKGSSTPQISAVQQAFIAQAMEADVVAVGARGDQPLLSGEINADMRGLSQILTEAALQPGTVHRPETPRQIGVQLATAFMAKGDRSVDVALNPEELGRVKMRVSTSETGITMVIQTERPETGDLMRRHINELADEFRKMGFDNISFKFSGEGAAAGGGMSDSEASAGGSQSGLGTEGEDLAMAEVAETAMQQLNLGNAGVDMRL